MIHVAGLALRIFYVGVESLFALDFLFQKFMAGQAFGRGNLFPSQVAFGTVFHPFQEGMGSMQFARGNLCQRAAVK